MILDTIPVLDLEPDFAIPPKMRGSRIQDLVDLSAAQRILGFRGKIVIHTLYGEWMLQTRAEVATLEEFFHDRKGKWDGFFVPSWHGELEPKTGISPAGFTIQITGVDYLATLGALDGTTKLGNYIFLLHRDGTLFATQVTDVTGTTTETITLRDTVPQEFALGDYIMGFLYYVRFLNDELELSYDANGIARANLSMQQICTVDVEADAIRSEIEDHYWGLDAVYRFSPVDGAEALLQGTFSNGKLDISNPPGHGFDIMLDYEEGACIGLTGGQGWGSTGVFYTAS